MTKEEFEKIPLNSTVKLKGIKGVVLDKQSDALVIRVGFSSSRPLVKKIYYGEVMSDEN